MQSGKVSATEKRLSHACVRHTTSSCGQLALTELTSYFPSLTAMRAARRIRCTTSQRAAITGGLGRVLKEQRQRRTVGHGHFPSKSKYVTVRSRANINMWQAAIDR